MSSTLVRKPSGVKRTWSIAEKRRVVELTMHEGVSVSSVAKQYNIRLPILSTWRKLYRNGKLGEKASEHPSILAGFLPVNISDSALPASTKSIRARIELPCGASLCIESDTLELQALATLFASVRT